MLCIEGAFRIEVDEWDFAVFKSTHDYKDNRLAASYYIGMILLRQYSGSIPKNAEITVDSIRRL